MKKAILLVIVVSCAAILWAANTVQPLDVKVGLWETTTVSQMTGMPPIPPDMLAKMTPEQKAKMEEMMKQRQAQGPQTHTTKKCVTKDDLGKGGWFDKEEQDCTKTVMTSTSRKLDVKLECTKGGGKQTGTLNIEAVDSGNVKGTMQLAMTNGTNTMNVNSSMTSKWLGSACGDVK